jgi:hypothetical protein
MIDFDNHRVWDHVVSVGTGATGFALGTVLATFLNPVVAPVILLAGMGLWYAGAQVIKRQEWDAETDGVIVDWNTGQILPPNPPRPGEPEPRRIPNLGEPVIMHSTSVSLNLVQKDLRWQQFCNAVLVHKTPMTQSKWTGKGRLFSKPEFSAKMSEWEQKKIIKLANPKNRNSGFTLSGGEGRRYFSDVANGKKWIALPYSD